MSLLALETATDYPSLAVGGGAVTISARALGDRRDLSRLIEGEVAALLAGAALRVRDLAGVVIADGPGSFTGLRIAAAFAKGVCRAAGVPLYAVPSMLGAARARAGDREGRTVLVEYDALRGDVYRAVYRFSPGAASVETLRAPHLARAEEPAPAPANATRAHERDAGAAQLIGLVDVPGGARRVADPGAFEPDYGRPAEAEARRLARR